MADTQNFSGLANLSSNSICFDTAIHIQKTNQKWKASELETVLLRHYFQNNQHPSADEKEQIKRSLQDKFGSEITIDQVTHWFKEERERTSKKIFPKTAKKVYTKFSKGDLDYLNERFSDDNYPKSSTMILMAEKMHVSLSKLENWYKHTRRSLARKGDLLLKAKKWFKKTELNYLTNIFEENPCPNKEKIIEIAKQLDCSKDQVKNWFSNRRKKTRRQKSRENTEKSNLNFQANKPRPNANTQSHEEEDTILSGCVKLSDQCEPVNCHFLNEDSQVTSISSFCMIPTQYQKPQLIENSSMFSNFQANPDSLNNQYLIVASARKYFEISQLIPSSQGNNLSLNNYKVSNLFHNETLIEKLNQAKLSFLQNSNQNLNQSNICSFNFQDVNQASRIIYPVGQKIFLQSEPRASNRNKMHFGLRDIILPQPSDIIGCPNLAQQRDFSAEEPMISKKGIFMKRGSQTPYSYPF